MWQKIIDWLAKFFDQYKSPTIPIKPTPQPIEPTPPPITHPSLASLPKGTIPWYSAAWDLMTFNEGKQFFINAQAKQVLAFKDRYLTVQNKIGIPWFFIGALHSLEANNDFRGCLANGERIIGTGEKTSLVPANRGPYSDWEASAIDAMNYEGFKGIPTWTWTLEEMLYRAERFNGIGYLNHGINSPYIWSFTNHYISGRYVADGSFDPNSVSQQVGVAPILKRLEQLGEIHLDRFKL